jgi:hypothetical protein
MKVFFGRTLILLLLCFGCGECPVSSQSITLPQPKLKIWFVARVVNKEPFSSTSWLPVAFLRCDRSGAFAHHSQDGADDASGDGADYGKSDYIHSDGQKAAEEIHE